MPLITYSWKRHCSQIRRNGQAIIDILEDALELKSDTFIQAIETLNTTVLTGLTNDQILLYKYIVAYQAYQTQPEEIRDLEFALTKFLWNKNKLTLDTQQKTLVSILKEYLPYIKNNDYLAELQKRFTQNEYAFIRVQQSTIKLFVNGINALTTTYTEDEIDRIFSERLKQNNTSARLPLLNQIRLSAVFAVLN